MNNSTNTSTDNARWGDEEIVAFVNGLHDKEADVGYETLTEDEQTVTLVSSLNFEVTLGGLSGFYSNTASNRVLETIHALMTVHADSARDALQQSSALFFNGLKYEDQEQRQEKLGLVSDRLNDAEALYDRQAPDLLSLLEDFIVKHFAPQGVPD